MTARARKFTAACVQMRSGEDKAVNLAVAEQFIAEAALRGARLVVLPEVFSWRGPAAEDVAAAETIAGPTLARLAGLAKKLRCTIVAGSILERSDQEGQLPYNTSVVLDENGRALAVYRKMHLFDVTIPGKVEVKESARRSRGSEPMCVDTTVGRLGLSVCYDLRFPELYRVLAARGAEIICIPSAFTAYTGAAHWDVLLRARAIENQCYVLAPNQIGPTSHGHSDYGHSSIVDPWGTVIARASDREEVINAEVDLEFQERVRAELPCLEHVQIGRRA